MKKNVKKVAIATILFLILYFFRQSIDYMVGENGDFFVGNFDLFYLFGLFYAGKYFIFHKKIKLGKKTIIYGLMLLLLVLTQILVLPEVNALKIVINAAKIVVCFFVMMYIKDNAKKINLKYFCFGFGILCAVFLVVALLLPQSILWRHNDYVNVFSQNRLQFLFSEPSELGLHAAIVLLFALNFFLSEKKKSLKRIIAYIVLIFVPIGFSLYFAKPLGAIAFGAVAIAIYLIARFVVEKNKKMMIPSVLSVIAIIFIGIFVLISSGSDIVLRLNAVSKGTDSSINYRVMVPIRVVERSFVDSNGIGLGLGNAKLEKNVATYSDIGLGSAGVINSFLNLIVEGGIIGVIFVISIIIALMRVSIKEKNPLKLALAVFIISFQFAGTYFTNPLCWLVYGYILFYKDQDPKLLSKKEEIDSKQ